MKKLIYLLLLAGIITSCSEENLNVVDANFSNPPIVKSVKIEPAEINLDTVKIGSDKNPDDTLNINLKITATVLDKDGQDDIAETLYEIINPLKSITLSKGKLAKLDSITFYAEPNFKIKRRESGNYYVKVFAMDRGGFSGNEVYVSLNLYHMNHPPVLSDLNAPDTVYIQPQTVLIKITIKAFDPDGNDDIKTVQFNVFKPDGSPSSGNPFKMYDDGNASGISGDEKAGDGIYSLIIQLPPNTQKGTYKFEFQAIDKSNEQSNIITHFMTVL
jgi:hypothetical protein